jgi:hypothetical protein
MHVGPDYLEERTMHAKMKNAALVTAFALGGCASVGQPLSGDSNSTRYELKNGSILLVDADSRMRMFNSYGDPLYMKDGAAMELKDGTVIAMKENVVWKQLRTRGTLSPRS